MYVSTGPTWESGHRVQCSVTVDPAAAVAWRGAGTEAVLHVMSLRVTSWTGPLPGIERDTLWGCSQGLALAQGFLELILTGVL
jgi:hypothetical protein